MNEHINDTEEKRLEKARESFSGRLLTDTQFDEAITITRIMEREIMKSGAFKDKLGDYAYAMARSEKIDATRAEVTIRDLFKARTGQTMNQLRERLVKAEENLPAKAHDRAYEQAVRAGNILREGIKMPFYRAYAGEAQVLGCEFGITDAAAKGLMCDAFKEIEDRELYEWGKEIEEEYYRPQIEAEKKERERERARDGDREHAGEETSGENVRSPSADSGYQAPGRSGPRMSP